MIAVWVSCGAASAVAAFLTVQRYGQSHEVRLVNNPVVEEGEDNRRFLRDLETFLGRPIESATHSRFPSGSAREVWVSQRYMSGRHGASCTRALKKEARQQWEGRNPPVDWHVFGFTAEERRRHERFVLTERSNVLPVLIDAGLTKQACLDLLAVLGLELPVSYRLGYPNANCIGCVKSPSPTYWNLVRTVDPDVFADRAQLSREIGCRLVRYRGRRIFLDELPPDAKGGSLKALKMPECGIFCEERAA